MKIPSLTAGQIRALKLIAMAAAAFALYQGNVELQTWLGQRALAHVQLTRLNLPKAEQEAQKSSKFILVDVSAIWCPTCRRLDQQVFANRDVQRYVSAHFAFSRLEYESPEGQAFLRDHQDVGFPSLWVLRGNGEPVRKLDLTFDPQDFIAELKAATR